MLQPQEGLPTDSTEFLGKAAGGGRGEAVRWGHKSHLASGHFLQVRLLLPSHEALLKWGGPTVPAAATIQTQVSLGLRQAGVRGDELPQALWGEEGISDAVGERGKDNVSSCLCPQGPARSPPVGKLSAVRLNE